MQLPEPIQRYFDVDPDQDAAGLGAAFAADAVVRDEGNSYRGLSEIEAWWRDARRTYEFKAVPFEQREIDGLVQVRALVTGNFPGSPATLTYRFALGGEGIAALEISA